MKGHPTYLTPYIPSEDWQKFVLALALAAVLVLLAKKAAARISVSGNNQALLVPESKISLFGFFDVFTELFVKFQDSILGKENRRYAPLTGTIFLFIFAANLLGLIPGMPAITTTVWINVGMALMVFIAFNVYGIKAHGLWGYVKHFFGPVIWLAWLVFPLEILSICIRVLTLNLRLYWNMNADHIVLQVMTDLLYGVPVIFYILGTFVCFMQAFVFTLLTMIYILLATQHGDEHEGEAHGH